MLTSLRMFLTLTILTGVAYPLIVYGAGRTFFPYESAGQIVYRDGRPIGSALLAQKFDSPRYFAGRPSAADYATVPSGASNAGPLNRAFAQAIEERRGFWKARGLESPPEELLLASGSGLDPHISTGAAHAQAPSVVLARGLAVDQISRVHALIEEAANQEAGPPRRVNVLKLNLALDAMQESHDP